MPPQTLNSIPSSNGSIIKWIAGGLGALVVILVAAWAGDISNLKERTSVLEANSSNITRQIDQLSRDIDRLEGKMDNKLSQVLEELRKK